MYDKKSFLKGLAMGLAGKPLEFAPGKEPVAYLYNGVRLPKLPEWDREAYPYAFISNEVLGYVVFCALAKRPFNNGSPTSKGTICNPYDESIPLVRYFLSADGNSWDNFYTGSLGTEGQISEPFWANFDVRYEDGTLYLGATIPLPVELFESGTWDFNGTKLPYLPTWDMSKYPYVMVLRLQYQGIGTYDEVQLWCTPVPFTHDGESVDFATYESDIFSEIDYLNGETDWSEPTERVNTGGGNCPHGFAVPIWANYDVINSTDQSIYLAASEPTPVYE